MTARQIEEWAARLRELRVDAIANFGLAAVAFGLALAASRLIVVLALPLLAGGLTATALGLRAYVRRCFLLDDLAEEPDARVIAEVRRHAARDASSGGRPAGPPQH